MSAVPPGPPPPSAPPPPGSPGGTSENAAGVTALVTGLVGIFLCPLVFSIIAIVFGRKGLAAADRGTADNRGLAQAGYILGIVGIVLFVLYVAIGVAIGIGSAG